ncbi:MAG TPA: Dabb family protein [Gemmataceae bacterium]|nr:Dabb family protein [Gemmataceae bacterium]
MKRRMFLAAAAALVVVAANHGAADAPKADRADKGGKQAPYVHVVIFHLKKDAPKGAADGLIKDAHELLAKIPSVRSIRAGRPADKVTPDFGRKDYDVALLVLFDDYDGLKAYLDHPMHLKYVERNLKNIDEKKLLVYDFSNQTK